MHSPGLPLPDLQYRWAHRGWNIGTEIFRLGKPARSVKKSRLSWRFSSRQERNVCRRDLQVCSTPGSPVLGAAGSSGSCPFSRFTSRIWLSIYQNTNSLQVEKDVNKRSPFFPINLPHLWQRSTPPNFVKSPPPAERFAVPGALPQAGAAPAGSRWRKAPQGGAVAQRGRRSPRRTEQSRAAVPARGRQAGSGRGGLLAPGSCSKVSPRAKASASVWFQLN